MWEKKNPITMNARPIRPVAPASHTSAIALVITAAEHSTMAICSAAEAY